MKNVPDPHNVVRKVLEEAQRAKNPKAEEAYRMVTEVTPEQAQKLMAVVRGGTQYLIGGPEEKEGIALVPGVEHSKENVQLLNDPKREKEYEACLKTLNEEERSRCPSFVDLMRQIKERSNGTLDALRARAEDLGFVVVVIYNGKGDIVAYRPGLIEVKPELRFLRNVENPENLTGVHYDKVYEDLSLYGLRPPEWYEYKALFAMILEMTGNSIDKSDWVLLNMGKRKDKKAQIALANESDGMPHQDFNTPDLPDGQLVSRPSVWGSDVLPKTT